MSKISELTNLLGTDSDNDNDLLAVADVSAAATKKMSITQLARALHKDKAGVTALGGSGASRSMNFDSNQVVYGVCTENTTLTNTTDDANWEFNESKILLINAAGYTITWPANFVNGGAESATPARTQMVGYEITKLDGASFGLGSTLYVYKESNPTPYHLMLGQFAGTTTASALTDGEVDEVLFQRADDTIQRITVSNLVGGAILSAAGWDMEGGNDLIPIWDEDPGVLTSITVETLINAVRHSEEELLDPGATLSLDFVEPQDVQYRVVMDQNTTFTIDNDDNAIGQLRTLILSGNYTPTFPTKSVIVGSYDGTKINICKIYILGESNYLIEIVTDSGSALSYT